MRLLPIKAHDGPYITKDHHSHFKGDFNAWFASYVSMDAEKVETDYCWRVRNKERLCSGERQDSYDIVVSLPILLIVELALIRLCCVYA